MYGLIRSFLFRLRMWESHPSEHEIPREMHYRRETFFLFLRDTKFDCLNEATIDFFAREGITYRLTRRTQWSPTPVFASERHRDKYDAAVKMLKREYRVSKTIIDELELWLHENQIPHVFENKLGDSQSSIRRIGTLRLFREKDAVHMALRFNVESEVDRKEREAAAMRRRGWGTLASPFPPELYRHMFFVSDSG